jgi:arylsulfatase A
MTRREFTGALAAAAFAATPQRPNFVFLLCDDLGYGDLACYGHEKIKTPNLDRLASEGLRFTDFYAPAPVCSPSRAGFMTGRTPSRAGIYDWIPNESPMHLRREETTVAKLLQKAGYQTCHSGKWHLNGKFNKPGQPQPGDHGFSHWFSTQNNALPDHHAPHNFVRNGDSVGPLEGYSSTIIADEAIDWLKRQDKTKPICLFVWFHSPHEIVATAPSFTAMYEPQDKRAEYYGNVTQMDHEAGRILRTLDDLQMRENTLVLFSSDNGPETLSRYPNAGRSYGSPSSFRGMKLHLYEGGIRVPGIARFPGVTKAGTETSAPASGVDLLPTFCELAGVPLPPKLDGASIAPILRGGRSDRRTPLFWHYGKALGGMNAAIREGDWKILGAAGPDRLDRFELYNLEADPGEKMNLFSRQPEIAKRMSQRLETIYREVLAEGPAWP